MNTKQKIIKNMRETPLRALYLLITDPRLSKIKLQTTPQRKRKK